MLSGKNFSSLQNFAKDWVVGSVHTFEEARSNAKKAGKLLAHLLSQDNEIF